MIENLINNIVIKSPNYCINNCTTSSSSTFNKNNISPKNVKKLDLNTYDIENYNIDTDIYNKLVSISIFNVDNNVRCEEDLKFYLLLYLKNVFGIVFNNKFSFNLYSNKIKTNPDIIIEDENNNVVFIIEIKTKFSLNFNEDIVEYYNKNFKYRENGNSGKICKCIDQLFTYMVYDNIKYGMLTNLETSWFTRVDKECFYISEPVKLDKLLNNIFKLLLMLKNGTNLHLINDKINLESLHIKPFILKFKKHTLKIFQNNLKYISRGTFSKIYSTNCLVNNNIISTVCLKICYHNNIDKIKNEIKILKFLTNKKANFAPVFYGIKKLGYLTIIVMDLIEDIDQLERIDYSICNKKKQLLVNTLKKLHNMNIVHNDIKISNYLFTINKKREILFDDERERNDENLFLYVIDFNLSEMTTSKQKKDEEMSYLLNILNLNPIIKLNKLL